MLSSAVTYRVALARIDDLRLQADERPVGNPVSAHLGGRKLRRAVQAHRVQVPSASSRGRVVPLG